MVGRSHGLRFEGTQFWVTHRRREYGPFDYEWSKDFRGVELVYRGGKFGEYCSVEEFFADLRPYHLPRRVVEVASIVMGCLLFGILNGLPEPERHNLLRRRLREFGLQRFLGRDDG